MTASTKFISSAVQYKYLDIWYFCAFQHFILSKLISHAFFRPGQPGIAQFFNRGTAQAGAGVTPAPALVTTTSVMNGTAAPPAGAPQPPQPPPAAPPAVNGTAAPSPVSKAPSEAPLPVSKDSKASVVDKPVDEESKKGRFGWFDIEKVCWKVLYVSILHQKDHITEEKKQCFVYIFITQFLFS